MLKSWPTVDYIHTDELHRWVVVVGPHEGRHWLLSWAIAEAYCKVLKAWWTSA